jgi:arylsulfatase A-like enzyme
MDISRRDFVKLCGAGAAVVGLERIGAGQALAGTGGSGPGSREILPMPDIPDPNPAAVYAQDVQYQPMQLLRPPEGAPNVVIILIDDMGFGAPSAFGGPCNMPTLERVAAEGLVYNRFHTTALCSPTRAALLTGRNHHTVGMGNITELATSAPGYTSVRPNSVAPIADVLRMNGYSTAAFGKMHQTPVWEVSSAGPFDRWPTGEGFEKFYGFVGAETNQFAPGLYDGTTPVEPPDDPDTPYHVTPDLVDHAVAWVQQQHALTPDKPFFVYLSFGATHAPHQVPAEWSDKYAGQFDQGWDAVREATLKRQKKLGIVPQNTQLTARPKEIKPWDQLTADERKVAARLMEIYAGFAEHTDYHAGRFLDALQNLGVLDDTLVIYIAGDNGASAEGTALGTYNEMLPINMVPDTTKNILDHFNDLGTVEAYNHYPIGWAHAMNCPYQWTKQVASHWGGTRCGLALRWPKGFEASGQVRDQFTHVIDIVPTILECAGLPAPVMVHGVTQKPMEGTSMVYSFDNAKAPERHSTQYFEVFGNRGIYHQGWSAAVLHRSIFPVDPLPWSEDVWELYDGATDWSQANNLATKYPERLAELQDLFMVEAARYNVFPLDDRRSERFNSDLAGRPDLLNGRTSLTLYPGMGRIGESAAPNVKNKSHTVTAELEVPEGGAEGVIIAQGGRFAGWSLYVKDGRLKYCHNYLGVNWYYVAAPNPLPTGKVTVKYKFTFDGGDPGSGGTGALYVGSKKVAEARIEKTVPFQFSIDETVDVGRDLGLPVTEDYPARSNDFTGQLNWVTIDIGPNPVAYHEPAENVYNRLVAGQ